ncbi:MAG TPA: monovalent cation/H+ antiporter complex subunit F [Terriglobales bacterium]|nr:monovalent cation/H+ antiporter complex subunit F [Terriglobales bacterium]
MNEAVGSLTIVVGKAVMIILGLAMFLAVVRLLRGPNLPDRVVALDLISILAIGIIGAYTILANEPVYLDAAIIVALLSFLATVGFAHFLEIMTFRKRAKHD